MTFRNVIPLLAGFTAAALALTACGGSTPGGTAAAGGKISVVTSTNVWGAVARAVGGDEVEVKAIISNSGADPHSYERTAADTAAVRDAGLVLYNGGGYDDFMKKILDADPAKPRIEAVSLFKDEDHPAGSSPPTSTPHVREQSADGHDHESNEHVWYDLDTVDDVAEAVAAKLGELKPDRKAVFTANAAKFSKDIDALEGKLDEIDKTYHGTKVLVTEPVAHYLVDAAGLVDVTPPEYGKAVEAETDPPAAAVAEVQKLITERVPRLLVYNPQTESPVTKQLKDKAGQAGVPVAEFTETLPEGKDYPQWMGEQITRLAALLAQR